MCDGERFGTSFDGSSSGRAALTVRVVVWEVEVAVDTKAEDAAAIASFWRERSAVWSVGLLGDVVIGRIGDGGAPVGQGPASQVDVLPGALQLAPPAYPSRIILYCLFFIPMPREGLLINPWPYRN